MALTPESIMKINYAELDGAPYKELHDYIERSFRFVWVNGYWRTTPDNNPCIWIGFDQNYSFQEHLDEILQFIPFLKIFDIGEKKDVKIIYLMTDDDRRNYEIEIYSNIVRIVKHDYGEESIPYESLSLEDVLLTCYQWYPDIRKKK